MALYCQWGEWQQPPTKLREGTRDHGLEVCHLTDQTYAQWQQCEGNSGASSCFRGGWARIYYFGKQEYYAKTWNLHVKFTWGMYSYRSYRSPTLYLQRFLCPSFGFGLDTIWNTAVFFSCHVGVFVVMQSIVFLSACRWTIKYNWVHETTLFCWKHRGAVEMVKMIRCTLEPVCAGFLWDSHKMSSVHQLSQWCVFWTCHSEFESAKLVCRSTGVFSSRCACL